MRIKSCYIENFGKLHQFAFSPDPHLTILVKENGWGKSTLAAFIKAMFYGMDYKPRAKLADSERKKYLPWQMGTYGGNLVFEQNGKTYRVERSFGKKASEDTFALYDEQSGRISEDYSDNLGEELFGVDQVSYGYTTYLAQNCHEVEGTDQILTLLTGENEQSGDKDVDSYSDAVKRLKEEAKKYKKTGGRGSIDITINRITQAEQELRTAQAQMASYGEWSEKLDGCLVRMEAKKKDLARDKDLVERAGIAEGNRARLSQMESLQKREKGLELQLAELSGHFPGLTEEKEMVCRQELSQLQNKAREWSRDKQDMMSRQTQLDTLSMMPVVVEQLPEGDENEPEKKDYTVLWLFLTGITAVLSLVLGILVSPVALSGLLLSLVFLIVCIRERSKVAQEANMRREQEKERQLRHAQQKKEAENERATRLSSYREELETLRKRCKKEEQELLQALSAYHMSDVSNYETAFVMLQEMLKNAGKLNAELREIREELDGLKQFGDKDKFCENVSEEVTMEQAMNRQKQDEEALFALLEEEKAYRSQMLRLEGAEEQARDLSEELESLRTKRAEEAAAYENIETTLQLLEEARERFSNRYADPVKKSFERYATQLGFGEAEQPCMDARLSLAVKAAGMQRETEYFSKGTRDLMWLCLRMAVVESVFTQEKPCLILDDPFSELDEEHNRKAQSVIRQLSDDYQILYMTCHESRASKL